MQSRTFIRILFNNIIYNNIFSKTFILFINFCNEFGFLKGTILKKQEKMPISIMETKSNIFFRSISGDKIDCQ